MRIALVSPYDFAFPGGVCNHISCLEQHLTKEGHEVKVVAPASKAIHTFGDRFIPVGKPRPIPASGSIARITISPLLASRIKDILEQEKFDICHLHEPLMPMLCTTVLRLANTANVGTFHASGGRSWYSYGTPIGKIFLQKWFRKLDGKIVVSKPANDYVNRFFPGEYVTIPNGIDSEHFHPDVKPFERFMDNKLNILFVGRLEKRKGLNYLLGAYQRIKREMPDCRLIVVGPGSRLHKRYQGHIDRYKIEDVVFVGHASYGDLARYYKTADIVCAPATGWESFGIILLEAMATGKPLVASNIEGYASVMKDGVEGLMVPPKNSEKLAEALMTLISDKARREKMGASGRTKAIKYDWTNVTRQVLDYYQTVLNGSPKNHDNQ